MKKYSRLLSECRSRRLISGNRLHPLVNSFANKIVETIMATLRGIDEIVQQPPPQVGIEAFGESSIDLGLRYLVPTKMYFQVLYRANLAIHKALGEAGITIPYPQREVHLKDRRET